MWQYYYFIIISTNPGPRKFKFGKLSVKHASSPWSRCTIIYWPHTMQFSMDYTTHHHTRTPYTNWEHFILKTCLYRPKLGYLFRIIIRHIALTWRPKKTQTFFTPFIFRLPSPEANLFAYCKYCIYSEAVSPFVCSLSRSLQF